jgi:lipopolysaccharide export system protein LptA
MSRKGATAQRIGRHAAREAAPRRCFAVAALRLCAGLLLAALPAAAAPAAVEICELSGPQSIIVTAEAANRWQQGGYEVWVLRGNCRIVQGLTSARSDEAVLWIDHADDPSRGRSKVITYLEGRVTIQTLRGGKPAQLTDKTWLGRFFTTGAVEVHAGVVAGRPDVLPGVYQRGMDRRNPAAGDVVRRAAVEQAQYASTAPPAPRSQGAAAGIATIAGQPAAPVVGTPLPPGTRRVRVFPRGDVPVQVTWLPEPQSNQSVAIFQSGVNFIVDGLNQYGSIDVTADRMVIWGRNQREPDLSGQTPQDERVPLEIYMEGNVVFRQGDRVIHASRMYYDVPNRIGTVLDADLLSPVPKYEGMLRLHAQIVQQVSPERMLAHDAFVTSSRLGVPAYRLQAGDMTLDDVPHPVIDPLTGMPAVNPVTGEPVVEHDRLLTSRNDVLYVDEVPIFYWPVMATDLNEPSYYVRRVQVGGDGVFGTQARVDLNMYQLLGMQKPPKGTDWDLTLDYLSRRGFAYGTTYLYHTQNLFGIPGQSAGLIDYFGLDDHGLDDLGQGLTDLKPEVDYRYRFLLQHRQELPYNLQLTVEGGAQSDRNFLQEYFKQEWDELKDQTTDVELRQKRDNTSWNVFASVQTDPFVTQTQWLPRGDHFWLGQPLLGDALTWFEHSTAGYASYRVATPPTNPADSPWSHMPWEASNEQGGRLISRQELDLPLQLGPVKVVPFVLGEVGYWGADLDGQQLDRVYGDVGVRATLPMWRIDPTVESSLWNVHGLAHKVDFELEVSVSGANRDLTNLPLYDPLNDWTQESFERRFITNTYGIGPVPPPGFATLPPQVDERFYALRAGMGDWVTAPSLEMAGEMEAIRLGVHQLWQTKRGPADDLHILDWIEFDSDVTFYPDPDRDNFGQVAGMLDYNFRWHVGDRLTVLSDGIFDFFDLGQREVVVGAYLDRPPRGGLYMGVRLLEGPINSQILSMAYNYQMSPKWVSTYGFSIDMAQPRNVGQLLRITRVGESLLVSGGFTYDPARNSVGAVLTVEPRFLPKSKLGMVGGARIPPAGTYGLE